MLYHIHSCTIDITLWQSFDIVTTVAGYAQLAPHSSEPQLTRSSFPWIEHLLKELSSGTLDDFTIRSFPKCELHRRVLWPGNMAHGIHLRGHRPREHSWNVAVIKSFSALDPTSRHSAGRNTSALKALEVTGFPPSQNASDSQKPLVDARKVLIPRSCSPGCSPGYAQKAVCHYQLGIPQQLCCCSTPTWGCSSNSSLDSGKITGWWFF